MEYVYTLVGFVLLIAGGESVLYGAVGTAKRANVSPLLISLTIVALGTSLPEMTVSVNAVLNDAPDISLGNIIGSNIANTLLLIGVAGFIAPLVCRPLIAKRDGTVMMLATLLFMAFAYTGSMGFISGVAMLCGLVGFTVWAYFSERKQPETNPVIQEVKEIGSQGKPLLWYLGALIVGIATVIFGADLFVDGAISIAQAFGVSQAVIGLTMVAVGTSLPELATVAPAIRKGQTEVVLGNILGSNVFNLLGVAGVVSVMTPLELPTKLLSFDVPVMAIVTLVFFLLLLLAKQVSRWQAAIFLGLYLAYSLYQYA